MSSGIDMSESESTSMKAASFLGGIMVVVKVSHQILMHDGWDGRVACDDEASLDFHFYIDDPQRVKLGFEALPYSCALYESNAGVLSRHSSLLKISWA